MPASQPLPASPPPRLQLLGTPCILGAEGQQHLLPPNDALLLAMLALDGSLTREHAAARLWPDNTPASARANLRQRLRKLQGLGPPEPLLLQGDQLSLAIGCDLLALPSLLQADPQAAQGLLLAPWRVDDDAETAQWLAGARQRVHQARNQALQQHISALTGSGQEETAGPWLQRLVQDNPADEALARQYMQWHHSRADRGGAAAIYARLQAELLQLHGTQPSAETQALAEWIAQREPVKPQQRPAHTVPWAALLRPPMLVERAEAWAQLNTLWQDGGTAVLVGGAGTGKTRLLTDFSDHVGLSLRLRAHDGDAGVPGALLARWVAARSGVAHTLPGWAREALSSLHPGLLTPGTGAAPSDLRLSQALQLLAQHDDAAWFDDLQHADPTSLALLPGALAGWRCCLLSMRGPQPPAALAVWLAQAPPHVHQLELPNWSLEGVRTLLANLPLNLAEPDTWAKGLCAHTGGRPGWVLHTLRSLLHQAPATDESWPAQTSWPMPTPAANDLNQSIARLSPDAQALLNLAALAGEDFSPALAASVNQQALAHIAQPWAELQAAQLVGGARPPGLVADHVASQLPKPLRQALCAALAQTLAAANTPPARLAQLWEAAGQPAQAAASHEGAAEAAANQSLRSVQIQHWSQAARLWRQAGHLEAALNATAEQAEGLLTSGDSSACLALCEVLDQGATNPTQWARSWRLRAWGLTYQRQFAQALVAAEKALPAAQAAGNLTWQSEVLGLKASLAGMLGQRIVAEQCLQAAQAMVLPADDWLLQLNHRSRIADGQMYLGRLTEALGTFEQCLVLSERPEARTERINLLGNTALLCFRLGLGGRALAHMREAVPLAERCGQLTGQVGGQALMQAALLEAAEGGYTAAVELAQRSLDVLQPLNVPVVLGLAENHLAWIWCCLGQGARALQLLRSAQADASPVVRLRRWALAVDLHRLCGTRPPGLPPEGWLQCEDPAVLNNARMAWLTLQTRSDQPTKTGASAPTAEIVTAAATADELGAMAEQLRTEGLVSQSLHAQVLSLRACLPHHPARAAALALQLQTALQNALPLGMHRPELHWLMYRGLQAGGHHAAAAEQLALAQAWIKQAAQGLHAAWQEAFLSRHALHAVVLRERG